jgi:M3 family oligoendopeptidase
LRDGVNGDHSPFVEERPMPLIETGLPAAPDMDAVTQRYRAFAAALQSGSPASWLPTFREWDVLRRELSTWASLTNLRFTQDTRNEAARTARDVVDELEPALTNFEIEMKKTFIGSGERGWLESELGAHAFRLWENDLKTFDPVIESDLVLESKLGADYMQLLAGIEIEFSGEKLNLAGLGRFATHPDRDVRHRAAAARWSALGERGAELDRIYAELVHVRDGIARKLGFRSFIELGYARMQRIDYDRVDVERYRDAVVSDVVPLASAIAQRAAKRHGNARLAVWDERLLAAAPAPKPLGDAKWIMERTIESFGDLDPRLGTFAEMMDRNELTDLVTRAGKAGGGYCTKLATYGVPFIFSNFNGTKGDVTVLMHELGHAFQAYSSREKAVFDYLTPTFESAEVHSMSLEYLTWPYMERFFGDGAQTFRESHLAEAILFLPYGAAVDHFQHLVYESPNATPDQRHAMWRSMEARYLPWRSYGDVERPACGAFWQSQLHIFRWPFYYIDYTLALCCALQMWASSYEDPGDTMARYVRLCARGGESAFRNLITSAGLASPFEAGVLAQVVARAKNVLAI